jgi:hypothetical protein
MDDDGRRETQEAIRRFESFSKLISPTGFDRYISRQQSAGMPSSTTLQRRMAGSGLLFSTR